MFESGHLTLVSGAGEGEVVSKKVGKEVRSLVFGECAFPPISLGPAIALRGAHLDFGGARSSAYRIFYFFFSFFRYDDFVSRFIQICACQEISKDVKSMLLDRSRVFHTAKTLFRTNIVPKSCLVVDTSLQTTLNFWCFFLSCFLCSRPAGRIDEARTGPAGPS